MRGAWCAAIGCGAGAGYLVYRCAENRRKHAEERAQMRAKRLAEDCADLAVAEETSRRSIAQDEADAVSLAYAAYILRQELFQPRIDSLGSQLLVANSKIDSLQRGQREAATIIAQQAEAVQNLTRDLAAAREESVQLRAVLGTPPQRSLSGVASTAPDCGSQCEVLCTPKRGPVGGGSAERQTTSARSGSGVLTSESGAECTLPSKVSEGSTNAAVSVVTLEVDGAEVSLAVDQDHVLGRGSYGVAFHGRLAGRRVAAKLVAVDKEPHEAAMGKLQRAKVALSLKDGHLVETLAVHQAGDEVTANLMQLCYGSRAAHALWVVMELGVETVQEHLTRRKLQRTRLDASTAVRWAAEAAAGVGYLHGERVLHGDLKPGNMLLKSGPSGEQVLMLADLDDTLEISTAQGTFRGTRQFLAPDVLKAPYAASRDVWALGVAQHMIVTGGRLPTGILRALRSAIEVPQLIRGAPRCIEPVLRLCWNRNWRCRIAAKDVVPLWSQKMVDALHSESEAYETVVYQEDLESFDLPGQPRGA
eukprot:TRINITY_DN50500_c0_g1_i1.p1 TRINITY_DN50500_c0_g1~~TRINITY_DN50500_c0_g1_i1.p1  ORF type:complete len:557 (+),score=136.66 TRINITY_DN50500_c0_g1_i1:74-1672(+)